MASLQRYNNSPSIVPPASLRSAPSNARALRRVWGNAEVAGLEIVLREQLGGRVNDATVTLYVDAVRRFSEGRMDFQDIVESTREGPCQLDTAAFRDGMLREMALKLRDNTGTHVDSMAAAANRSFDTELPRSFWQWLLGR